MLVRAVLAPERADDPELREGRLASEHGDETIVLVAGETMFGDERRSDLRIAWASGDGHGALVAGLEEGAGLIVGGFFGIDGRTSFASAGGFIRTDPDEDLAAPAEGARSAASFAEMGAGELLVPV